MTYGKQVQDELRPHARELRRMIPGVYRGFAALHDAALVDGALDTKTKELIALAIAVSSECDGVSPRTPTVRCATVPRSRRPRRRSASPS